MAIEFHTIENHNTDMPHHPTAQIISTESQDTEFLSGFSLARNEFLTSSMKFVFSRKSIKTILKTLK